MTSPIYGKYILILVCVIIGFGALIYTKNPSNEVTKEAEIIVEKELGVTS